MGGDYACGRDQGQRGSGVIQAGYGGEQWARSCQARAWLDLGRAGWQTRTWTLVDHGQTLTTGSPKLGMNDEVAAGRIPAG